MSASSTWESFSTFLDQQQQPNQPAPGQLPDWSQNFQLGQRPNYNENINIEPITFPGAPIDRQVPGIPANFNPNAPIVPFNNAGNEQYGVQQLAGVTAPAQANNPAGGLFSSLGQGRKQEERQRNRGGAYGSAKRDKLGNWSFN